MTLSKIDQQTLIKLQPFLSLSAGYQVSIEDELKYFDPDAAKSWFLATGSEGQNLGFIRNFKQGAKWSLGELYVHHSCRDRGSVARALLESFSSHVGFDEGHRLRFDIRIQDTELNNAIAACGFSQKTQMFLHFEKLVENVPASFSDPKPVLSQVHEIVETLNYLNEVTEAEVAEWINRDSVRVVTFDSKVVSAAQIFEHENDIEINRIATHAAFLRRGHAMHLISQISHEALKKGKTCVCLKVEDIKTPAVAVYKRAGFQEDKAKSQIWHSRWY